LPVLNNFLPNHPGNVEPGNFEMEQAERMISIKRVRFQQENISALDLNGIELKCSPIVMMPIGNTDIFPVAEVLALRMKSKEI
jgi:hypothetical protein